MEANAAANTDYPSRKKRSRKTTLWFFLAWMLLVASGVLGAMQYASHLKNEMLAELARQTEERLDLLQQNYQNQLKEMNEELTILTEKVESFNQLLTFAKETANEETDQSNQLYTQLEEVKAKLEQLEKNLELLK